MGELGCKSVVYRNDEISPKEIIQKNPKGIIISPGPGRPTNAGICLELLRELYEFVPVLGVCLGHQCIGYSFGARIIRAPIPMHGKISIIEHQDYGIFKGIPNPFNATRYHSLIVDPKSLPKTLKITAKSSDGVIQGLTHIDFPLFGVQFHPESISSQYGHAILKNFIEVCETR